MQKVFVLAAIGSNEDGCWEIIGATEDLKKTKSHGVLSLYGSKNAVLTVCNSS